jgi:hypothetical protein
MFANFLTFHQSQDPALPTARSGVSVAFPSLSFRRLELQGSNGDVLRGRGRDLGPSSLGLY